MIVCFADDLTGSGDVGMQFRGAGLSTTLFVAQASASSVASDAAEAIVIDTDSRNVAASAAAERQLNAVAALSTPIGGDAVVYKKVDSTIRGNVGAEIAALMRALEMRCCLFAPAFPSSTTPRTTVGGFQLVGGIPVHRTEMGSDAAAPVTTSQIARLFDGIDGVQCVMLSLDLIEKGAAAIAAACTAAAAAAAEEGTSVVCVCDATSDEDLAAIAHAAATMTPRPLLAGSAGLAAALVPAFALASTGSATSPLAPRGAAGRVVVVSGSTTTQNGKQIAALETAFAGSDSVALHQSTSGDIATLTAEAVEAIVADPPAGLVLAGGATAAAVVRGLGARGLRVISAVESAVPLLALVGGAHDGLAVVTKAGALGSNGALVNAVRAVRSIDASHRASLPLIGITMGDPCGVGPEIIAKALAKPECHALARFVVIGSAERMQFGIDSTNTPLTVRVVASPEEALCTLDVIDIVSPFDVDLTQIETGVVGPEAGRCAAEWVIAATKFAVAGSIDAIATAPLNKEAMHLGGYKFGGHTELLRDYSGAKTSRLCLADPRGITVVHATCHIPFKDIPTRIADEGKIVETIRLAREFCIDMGYTKAGKEGEPKIAIAGLNPHCEPIFGDEETRIIAPAIAEAAALGWNVHGPIPADTVFLRAKKGEFDVVVAMYHDQGHIPAKVSGFGDTVNCTLGLPIIRTSVDHGTAFDIAGKGIAHEQNLVTAIAMAAQMATTRMVGTSGAVPMFSCGVCGVATSGPPDSQLFSCECCT